MLRGSAWEGGGGSYVTIALRSGGNSVTFSDSCLVAGQKKLLFCITVNSQSEGGILGADAHRRPTANCSSFSGFLFANADGKTTGLASRSRETSRGFRATAESKLLLRSPLNEPKTLNASANVRTSERERKKNFGPNTLAMSSYSISLRTNTWRLHPLLERRINFVFIPQPSPGIYIR